MDNDIVAELFDTIEEVDRSLDDLRCVQRRKASEPPPDGPTSVGLDFLNEEAST